jgi:hypothetical protein
LTVFIVCLHQFVFGLLWILAYNRRAFQ